MQVRPQCGRAIVLSMQVLLLTRVSGDAVRSKASVPESPQTQVMAHARVCDITRVDAGAAPESGKTLCMHRNR